MNLNTNTKRELVKGLLNYVRAITSSDVRARCSRKGHAALGKLMGGGGREEGVVHRLLPRALVVTVNRWWGWGMHSEPPPLHPRSHNFT